VATLPTNCFPQSELSDEDLISSSRSTAYPSRNDVVEELVRRHHRRIIGWCYRFTRDREAALDLAQEILLRAFRNLDHYRGECRFSTWLYVIARNQCMTALQKRASEPVWVTNNMATDLPDRASSDFYNTFEKEEARQRKWRFILDTLDSTEAKVMMLHYGEELPLTTVSRMLGLTNKSGAKAYVVSARRKLDAAVRLRAS
jgi:RNA polymerase sigma-70 factor, ECF subfamily